MSQGSNTGSGMIRSRSTQNMRSTLENDVNTHQTVELPLLKEDQPQPHPHPQPWYRNKKVLVVAGGVTAGVVLLSVVVGLVFVDHRNFSEISAKSRNALESSSSKTGLKYQDPNRPHYHVMPEHGWLNDPNGLMYLNGMYHTFFQYNPYSPHWNWSIHWGHAASPDLVHWIHLPPALAPSKDGPDCGGCWSGSMTLSKEGVPTIVFTGVAQDNSDCVVTQAQRNWQYNPQDGYRETVMWAQPDLMTNNDDLVQWPTTGVLIEGPPEGMRLMGWRDPFVYQRGGLPKTDGDYILMVGTGRRNEEMTDNYGGAVMAYSSNSLNGDWKYEGFMLEGTPDDAEMWECPWMVEITPEVGSSPHTHVISVGGSLWSATHPLEPNNPVIFWLGHFNETTFKFTRAKDAYTRIDIGQTFYASNRMIDGNGRVMIWGWLRECMNANDPRCANHDYAGSLSMPRVLKVEGNTVRQDVPEEIIQLRGDTLAESAFRTVAAEESFTLFKGSYHHYETMVTFSRQDSKASGVVLLRSGFSMLIVYSWDTQDLRAYKGVANDLESLNPIDVITTQFENYGGTLQNMKNVDELTLQIFVDGSSIEVFASSGEVMSLRLYFDEVAKDPIETVQVVSYYGVTTVNAARAWVMDSIWQHPANADVLARALKSFPM